jgi:ATP-dependent RNA helicase DeaD
MATGFKVNFCYGGHSIDTELNNLRDSPAILIGTPGRLVDHLERSSFDASTIQTLVLDEFDKSLQLGFHEEMRFIIEKSKSLKKRILVSATEGVEIPNFVGIRNLNRVNFISEEVNENLAIKLVYSKDKDKIDSLFQLICSLNSESAIVFCNHSPIFSTIVRQFSLQFSSL